MNGLHKLLANGQVATQYVDRQAADADHGRRMEYQRLLPMAIEGITSPDGRVLGKMAHSERRGDGVAINIYGRAGYEDL